MEAEDVQTNFSNKSHENNGIFCKIVTCTGCLTYELFSTHIMMPDKFKAFFGSKDLAAADLLWFHTHVGIGLYLYHQPILQKASTPWRVTYTVFGTTLFNFGSALLWGSFKMVAPKSPEAVKVTVGLTSGGLLLYIGYSLLDFLNSLLLKDKKSPFEDTL